MKLLHTLKSNFMTGSAKVSSQVQGLSFDSLSTFPEKKKEKQKTKKNDLELCNLQLGNKC